MSSGRPASAAHILAALAVGLSMIVYLPILGAYFWNDDFLNLYQIVNLDPVQYLLRPHGGHLLATRNAIFLLCHHAFGMWAPGYYALVLLSHGANVWLLFQVIRRCTASDRLAAFGAALWGTCPLHAGTLDWYSVYGQVVVAMVLLVILERATARPPSASRGRLVVWPVLLLAACTSFGVGLGVALVAPIVVALLLPASARRASTVAVLALVAVAVPFLYRQMLALYEQLAGPSGEVTTTTILLGLAQTPSFWPTILTMLAGLAAYGLTGLSAGFAFRGGPPPDALVRPVAVVATVAVLWVLARGSRDTRRYLIAMLVLVAGTYGMVAMGRAVFFAGDALHIGMSQPRYHYVGTIPLAIILGIVLAHLGARLPAGGVGPLLLGSWALATLGLRAASAPFIDTHAEARVETERVVTAIRAEVAATPPGATVRIPYQQFLGTGPLIAGNPMAFPGWAALFTIVFPSNSVDGRPVFFVASPEVVAATAEGRRTAGLLVPPPP